MIGACNRKELRTHLNLPEEFEVLLVIAIGKPAETVLIEAIDPDGNIKYWRDENHVPKRLLKDIVW